MKAFPSPRHATWITLFVIVLWAGFLLHSSPRFPSSRLGLSLGIGAALALTVPLAYSLVKRVGALRSLSGSARQFAWHIWSGWAAGALAVIHSGHRYDSVIGIALMSALLLTLLTGYIGQYYHEIHVTDRSAKEEQLQALHARLDALKQALLRPLPQGGASLSDSREAVALAAAIAHVEHGIFFSDRVHIEYQVWWWLHVASAVALYAMLTLHVSMELVFAIRWLEWSA